MNNKKRTEKSVPLESVLFINEVLTSYYKEMNKAKKSGKLIAYLPFGFPKNYFYAMDVFPVYPQLHAGLQSARRKTENIMGEVEAEYELPDDLCGEVKTSIGTALYGDSLKFKLPKPDMIVTGTNVCMQAAKGFQLLSNTLNLPFFHCDLLPVFDETHGSVADYGIAQGEELVKWGKKNFGVKFDEDSFYQGLKNDYIALQMWKEALKLLSLEPVPVYAMDLYIYFFMLLVLNPATDLTLDITINLYNSVYKNYMKLKKKQPFKKEIRILWDLLPVYHKQDFFRDVLAKHNAVVAVSSYFFVDSDSYPENFDLLFQYPVTKNKVIEHIESSGFDPNDLLRYFLNGDSKKHIKYKELKMKKMIKDFKIDAAIFHVDRTCRTICLIQYELMKYVENELGIPVFAFDADSMDERFFSASQVTTRLEAFMENL